jgi:hypothetical protein
LPNHSDPEMVLKPSGLQRLSRLYLGRMWSGHLLIAACSK